MKETIAILVVAVVVVLGLSVYLTQVEKAVYVPDAQPTIQPVDERTTLPTVQPSREGVIRLAREDVREELKDLNNELNSTFITPYLNMGVRQGYRVMGMLVDSLLVKLGIQEEDVITHLNGNVLTSPELLFSTLSQIDNISAVTIDIIRNNEKKTLFVEIQ